MSLIRYEYYATDGKPAIAVSGEPKLDGDSAPQTDGRAVEVLELASGETIWCVNFRVGDGRYRLI